MTPAVASGVAVAVVAAALLLVLVLPGWGIARIARTRGRRFWPWFAFGTIQWPAALIALFAARDLSVAGDDAASPPLEARRL